MIALIVGAALAGLVLFTTLLTILRRCNSRGKRKVRLPTLPPLTPTDEESAVRRGVNNELFIHSTARSPLRSTKRKC